MKPLLSGYVQGSRLGGPECESFERELEMYYGVPHARVFNSATSALHASLVALNAEGSDVIVPAYTMSACAAAIVYAGANPVFGDIDDQYCLSKESFRALQTDRTGALVYVYLFGHHPFPPGRQSWLPCKIPVVHDCSQAPSLKPSRMSGPTDVWVYSLNQNKIMSTGEGGYVLTYDGEMADRLHAMRNHGEDTRHNILGFNYRMTEGTAAAGREQLEKLHCLLAERRAWAERFENQYGYGDPNNRDWYRLPIRVQGTPKEIQRIADHVGGTRGYTTPTHKLPWFQHNGWADLTLPNTELIESQIIMVTPS